MAKPQRLKTKRMSRGHLVASRIRFRTSVISGAICTSDQKHNVCNIRMFDERSVWHAILQVIYRNRTVGL